MTYHAGNVEEAHFSLKTYVTGKYSKIIVECQYFRLSQTWTVLNPWLSFMTSNRINKYNLRKIKTRY